MKLVDRAKTIWKLFTVGGMSKSDKWILVLALLYCLSPVDIIPDVVPVVGLLDDFLMVVLALRHVTGKAKGEEQVPVDVKVS